MSAEWSDRRITHRRAQREPDLRRRVTSVTVALVGLLATLSPASAQTPDDLFNPDVLQRIDLRVHSLDWEKLKQNFLENTYYPADFVWNGITVYNSGIRSRGLGSRSATKPGLRSRSAVAKSG